VDKGLKRIGTDYIDLLQIYWPDRYVPLLGEFSYDPSKWKGNVPFIEQLKLFSGCILICKVALVPKRGFKKLVLIF
jgi:diketogulonate reductase-like aldo/keto reductase